MRDKGLRDPARQGQLSRELAKLAAPTYWRANPRVGCVVANFAAGDIPMTALEARLDAAVN